MNRALLSILVILMVLLGGCKKQTETATAGHRLLLAADPYVLLMQQEAEQFVNLYPQVNMDVRGVTTREAIVLLLNDSVHIIAVDRQFNEEEKQVAQQASLRLVESKIAEDGVAIIVHKQNPLSSITPESARQIITKTVTEWSQLTESHWSGPIDVVLTGRNSGMQELLQKKIFSLPKLLEPTTVMNAQRDVIQYVSEHPQSVGCVAASLLADEQMNVKILPVSIKSPDGSEKAYFPKQQEIYESLYPFHYSLYLYTAETKAAVGLGFSALVLSNVGQKIFQRSGLVPVSIPYRTIQLHAE
jgi:phosphate transport system substrate-binding protein